MTTSQQVIQILVLLAPALIGGLIAAFDSNRINDVTEAAESTVRGWQSRLSARSGFFFRYILNPPLWVVVRFADWTDNFAHQGLKNGTRVAAALYMVGLWVFLIYAAVVFAVVAVMFIAALAVLGLILALFTLGPSGLIHSMTSRNSGRRMTDEDVIDHVGFRDQKVYAGTNWFNEELRGRIDHEGNLYRGTSWLNEEKIGRVDDEGNIYKGTSLFSEEKIGRIDQDGTLYKGANWFKEERTGRIDEDGAIQKGTNWFNEERRGRTGD